MMGMVARNQAGPLLLGNAVVLRHHAFSNALLYHLGSNVGEVEPDGSGR
jgi:hypothetical protein